ncbi:MAG: hypothetical protein IJ744_08250 [Lachnospiraceae bacterium]|nr:hypothetical protein [Lachnospiraceae bacterium]
MKRRSKGAAALLTFVLAAGILTLGNLVPRALLTQKAQAVQRSSARVSVDQVAPYGYVYQEKKKNLEELFHYLENGQMTYQDPPEDSFAEAWETFAELCQSQMMEDEWQIPDFSGAEYASYVLYPEGEDSAVKLLIREAGVNYLALEKESGVPITIQYLLPISENSESLENLESWMHGILAVYEEVLGVSFEEKAFDPKQELDPGSEDYIFQAVTSDHSFELSVEIIGDQYQGILVNIALTGGIFTTW